MKRLMYTAVLLVFSLTTASGQGTGAFYYQGRLDTNGISVSGPQEMAFRLYTAETLGNLRAGPITVSPVDVSNGLFGVAVDFGLGAFDGEAYWIEVAVRSVGSGSPLITLGPRQRAWPAPYALFSTQARGLKDGAAPTLGTATFNAGSGPPFHVNSTGKVLNLNADLLDGLDSSDFINRAGDNMLGNLTLTPPATLSFGRSVRQMINLWSTEYAIGVQADTLYSRSANHYAWYRGGAHVDTELTSGGGETLMTLRGNGNLAVTATGGTAVNGDASATVGGIGVYGQAGNPADLGIFGFFPAWGVQGRVTGTNSGGVYGEAVAQTSPTWGVRGRAHSAMGFGVAGENDSSLGIGVYGFNGLTGSGGTVTRSGVHGESTEINGNGAVGTANSGANAFGVWGRSIEGRGGVFSGGNFGVHASSVNGQAVYGNSSSGFAGQFDGAVRINFSSPPSKPQLQITEPSEAGFARMHIQGGTKPYWDIAVGTQASPDQTNSLRFFNIGPGGGDVMTLSPQGRLFVRVLTITGGADLAEPFEMPADVPKGAVVIIDDENPGRLKMSATAYDTRVAGIVSGANGVNPGLTLQQQDTLDSGQQVALSGRTYVQADATAAPIKPGDLLTTADIPGHAMKASDRARSHGAILGKAMTGLKEGRGLVLALVSLQ